MAEGVRFDIAIEANGIGVDATADSLNALAEKVTYTNKVATTFDRAVAAVRTRLDEAANATRLAAAALGTAETRYKELESAANKAAKEVEKATLAGKDTTALQAAAFAATAKMREQATAVDALRVKSDQAAAAQLKLAGTLKTLEGQQAAQVAQIKKGQAAAGGAAESVSKLGASEAKVGKLSKALSVSATVGMTAAAALVGLTVAAIAGVGALGAFAIASRPAEVMKLTMATERLKLGFKNLFTGLKLDGFTNALVDIMSLFDKGTSSANAMKVLVETIMQPLFDGAAKAGPYVKEMFKGLIYGAMQVVIAVLKIRNEIFKAMSPETRAVVSSVSAQIFTMENAFKVGTAAAIVLTVAVGALAVAVIASTWPILAVIAAVAGVIAIITNWGAITDWLVEMWDGFVAFIKRIPDAWVSAAKAMIDGLVKGIKDGAAAVWKAMSDLAGGAIDSFKQKLGIKSPSVVMQMNATHTVAGYVEGIEDGAPKVDAALESMVTIPEPSSAPGGASKGSASSGGPTNINIAVLNVGDTPVAKKNWTDLQAVFVALLEGGNLTIGGGEVPA